MHIIHFIIHLVIQQYWMYIVQRGAKTDLIKFALLTIVRFATVQTLHKESSNPESLRTQRLRLIFRAAAFVEKDLRILSAGFLIWLRAILKKLSEENVG